MDPHRGIEPTMATGGEHSTGSESPAGWHPDPSDAAFLRWWNGETWTDDRRPRHPDSVAPDAEAEQGIGLPIVGYALALLFPFIGFVVGLAMISGGRKHGAGVVLTSLAVFLFWLTVVV